MKVLNLTAEVEVNEAGDADDGVIRLDGRVIYRQPLPWSRYADAAMDDFVADFAHRLASALAYGPPVR